MSPEQTESGTIAIRHTLNDLVGDDKACGLHAAVSKWALPQIHVPEVDSANASNNLEQCWRGDSSGFLSSAFDLAAIVHPSLPQFRFVWQCQTQKGV